jgi:hypothetical protein
MQERRFEPQECDDFRSDARADCPLTPVFEVRFEVKVYKAIAQRPRHGKMNTAFGGRIAGGDNDPAVRELVFSQLPISNQMIAAGLPNRLSRCKFIEKQNAVPRGR